MVMGYRFATCSSSKTTICMNGTPGYILGLHVQLANSERGAPAGTPESMEGCTEGVKLRREEAVRGEVEQVRFITPRAPPHWCGLRGSGAECRQSREGGTPPKCPGCAGVRLPRADCIDHSEAAGRPTRPRTGRPQYGSKTEVLNYVIAALD